MEASVVLLERGDRILLLRRSATDSRFPLHWNFPGGRIDTFETATQAAIRETFEETGITLDPSDLDFIGSFEEGGINVHLFRAKTSQSKVVMVDKEHDQYVWITPSEIVCYRALRLCTDVVKYLSETEQI